MTTVFGSATLGSTLLLYPMIYYCIQHFTRYRYPILWVSSLLAAYALDQAWLKLRRTNRNEKGKTNPKKRGSYQRESA